MPLSRNHRVAMRSVKKSYPWWQIIVGVIMLLWVIVWGMFFNFQNPIVSHTTSPSLSHAKKPVVNLSTSFVQRSPSFTSESMFNFSTSFMKRSWSPTLELKNIPAIINLRKTARSTDKSHTWLVSNTHTLEWKDQRPIGSGRIGALVGGTLSAEVIPLSMEGFFVIKGISEETSASSISEAFQNSRKFMMEGNIRQSQNELHRVMKGQPPLGAFQYIADTTLVYSQDPIVGKLSTIASNSGSKSGLISTLSNSFTLSDIQHNSVGHGFGNVVDSTNTLHTISGIATTIFLLENDNASATSDLYYRHERSWFASSVDDVIVGSMKCHRTSTTKNIFANNFIPDKNSKSNENMKGCFHGALRLTRFYGGNNFLSENNWNINEWTDGNNSMSHLMLSLGIDRTKVRLLSLTLNSEPKSTTIHRPVELCAIAMCNGKDSELFVHDKSSINSDANKKSLVCNNADELNLIFSIQTDPNWTYHSSIASTSDIQNMCWKKIINAANLGTQELRKRHTNDHAAKMTESEMNFVGPVSDDKDIRCTETNITFKRLLCLSDATKLSQSHSSIQAKLTTSAYWFNKYLLLASSSQSVSNLQGLWADGPTSAWNGDYHLNINLQMNYWAANTVFEGKTVFPPLIAFIKKMAESGKKTAQSMYGCRGWVGHGFTDNLFDMGVRGGPMWAMCVSCGAWMSLHLWEYVTFNSDIETLQNTLIPVFRSTAEFFLDHLFEDKDGIIHSGPTTSPENSYVVFTPARGSPAQVEVLKSHPNRQTVPGPNPQFYFTTLSPAIDISVLRQVAVAYKIAIEWLGVANNTVDLSSDLEIVNKFTHKVSRMSGKGVPVIGKYSGKIREYPHNVGGCVETESPTSDVLINNATCGISEEFDLSHRHFSGMHWLYPGTFLPESNELKPLYEAARKTVEGKVMAGGGHTGWSAAWEANLWARLRQSVNVDKAMTKILLSYITRNMLGLHPPLSAVYQGYQCNTCYFEDHAHVAQSSVLLKHTKIGERNMELEDNSKFQIDTNNGFLAAIVESIVQSHIPGIIHLLPALPSHLEPYGVVKKLRVRGDGKASIMWNNGSISVALLSFRTKHPWLNGQKEIIPGFFESKKPSDTSNVILITPNVILGHAVQSNCASISPIYESPSQASYIPRDNDKYLAISFLSFPCDIAFCGIDSDRSSCLNAAAIL